MLLKWNNGLPSDKKTVLTLLKNSLQNDDSTIFWKLVENGADSYLSSKNDLMREASYKFADDSKVINYLAKRVPANDYSLAYAVKIENPEAVRTILERGSFSNYKIILTKDNKGFKAIKALLKEKNIAFEVK